MSEPRYAFEEKGRFARGWHIVALSQELAKGDVKALHYFNEDLVLFRGDSGEAVILDAYCPHLGAHLAGTGSRVVGDTIRCPFHGWQFDCSGSCTAIPYANKIPDRARNALKRRNCPRPDASGHRAQFRARTVTTVQLASTTTKSRRL